MKRQHSMLLSSATPAHQGIFTIGNTVFSETTIMQLQDMLLMPGASYIQVGSVAEGRVILHVFLESLGCYTDLACLTMQDNQMLPARVFDMYGYWLTMGHINDRIALNTFMAEELTNDFIWIEHTALLQQQPWLHSVEQALEDGHSDHSRPVLHITYSSN